MTRYQLIYLVIFHVESPCAYIEFLLSSSSSLKFSS